MSYYRPPLMENGTSIPVGSSQDQLQKDDELPDWNILGTAGTRGKNFLKAIHGTPPSWDAWNTMSIVPPTRFVQAKRYETDSMDIDSDKEAMATEAHEQTISNLASLHLSDTGSAHRSTYAPAQSARDLTRNPIYPMYFTFLDTSRAPPAKAPEPFRTPTNIYDNMYADARRPLEKEDITEMPSDNPVRTSLPNSPKAYASFATEHSASEQIKPVRFLKRALISEPSSFDIAIAKLDGLEDKKNHFTTGQLKRIYLWMKEHGTRSVGNHKKEFTSLLADLGFLDPEIGINLMKRLREKTTKKFAHCYMLLKDAEAVADPPGPASKETKFNLDFADWTDAWLIPDWDGSIEKPTERELSPTPPPVSPETAKAEATAEEAARLAEIQNLIAKPWNPEGDPEWNGTTYQLDVESDYEVEEPVARGTRLTSELLLKGHTDRRLTSAKKAESSIRVEDWNMAAVQAQYMGQDLSKTTLIEKTPLAERRVQSLNTSFDTDDEFEYAAEEEEMQASVAISLNNHEESAPTEVEDKFARMEYDHAEPQDEDNEEHPSFNEHQATSYEEDIMMIDETDSTQEDKSSSPVSCIMDFTIHEDIDTNDEPSSSPVRHVDTPKLRVAHTFHDDEVPEPDAEGESTDTEDSNSDEDDEDSQADDLEDSENIENCPPTPDPNVIMSPTLSPQYLSSPTRSVLGELEPEDATEVQVRAMLKGVNPNFGTVSYEVINITVETYEIWKRQLQHILKLHGAWGIISGELRHPRKPVRSLASLIKPTEAERRAENDRSGYAKRNEEYLENLQLWERMRVNALGWMLLTMGKDHRNALRDYDDPCALWQVLENEFEPGDIMAIEWRGAMTPQRGSL